MEIEIVTTKKKLTKSIFNQFLFASTEELKDAEALGFVCEKQIKHGLIKTENGYRKLSLVWDIDRLNEDELEITRRGGFSMTFKSKNYMDLFKEHYPVLKHKCLETQIFL